MIGLRCRLVDFTAKGPEGRAKEDVVDTHKEGACMEGDPEPIAFADEGIFEAFADLVPSIGERSIIEVTTDDDPP